MADSNYIQEMHSEHQEWLYDISHWERELDFLETLTQKVQKKETSESLKKAAGELENRAYHKKTLLKQLKEQIHSHEAFIRDQSKGHFKWAKSQGVSDHQDTRHQVRAFKAELRELKHEIFQLCEEAL